MKVEGTRSTRRVCYAAMTALASILLASCSTSNEVPFGLDMIAAQSTAPSPADAAAPAFVFDADDPGLPTEVADVPTMRDGSAPVAVPAAYAQAPAAVAAAMPDAVPPTQSGPAVPEATMAELLTFQQVAMASALRAARANEAASVATAQAAPVTAGSPTQEAAAPTLAMTAEEGSADTGTAQPQHVLESGPGPQPAAAPAASAPKKKNFLSAFFGPSKAHAAPMAAMRPAPLATSSTGGAQEAARGAPTPLIDKEAPAAPPVELASAGPIVNAKARASAVGDSALPGVRHDNLFEIRHGAGFKDNGDVDLHEDGGGYQVASMAPGLARLAPNGLLTQREDVDVACLKPSLVRVLKQVEAHFGSRVIVTSGYRDPDRNRRARGARKSLHMYCAAADVQVPGVSKAQLASYLRAMPGRGGVGTYCHTQSVHIDVGPERDWNWRCRRR